MPEFRIDVRTAPDAQSSGPLGIALRVGDLAFTRLLRPREPEADDYLLVPPGQFAFWLVDNWWRIRWEGILPSGVTTEWRLAHEMSSIGGGYAWPRLAIWGEESRIGLLSRSDPPGVVGPVRYLTDALVFIGAAEFEMTIDQFLNEAIDGYASGTDRLALQAQVEALRAERDDSETSEWRRMEARLGFDPDAAPDAVVEALATLAGSYGNAGVEEAAMATPGPGAADTLEAGIEAARRTRVECRFGPALKALGPITRNGEAPWRLAERSASSLRRAFGCVAGQLSNANLANLLETSRANFKTTVRTSAAGLPYGLRLVADDSDRHRIVIRSRWSGDRRFELARGLGDAIWADCDRLGPLAASKSARQKFQRAFAQSLLCPYEDLIAYIGTQPPTDDDIAAAANHFYVSERVVRTVLVNKGILDRDRLERLPAQTLGLVGLGDWVEAA